MTKIYQNLLMGFEVYDATAKQLNDLFSNKHYFLRAICDIQGGPKYEVKLQGEASLIEYRFNKAVINYDKQVWFVTR